MFGLQSSPLLPLLLPSSALYTSGHGNSLQLLCEVKCILHPISSRFACTRSLPFVQKRSFTRSLPFVHKRSSIDAVGFQDRQEWPGKVGNPQSFPCKADSDTDTSSMRFGKRAFIACTVAAFLFCDKLPPFLQNSLRPGVAHASLVQMPPDFLNNRYYLVRAGESEFERIGVINTNPVTKTNVESGLSENGRKQTVKAALQLREMGACDGSCWIWPSITQRAYQTAEIIAYFNNVNRSRIVPEYSFLDARGVGAYEGKSLSFLNQIYESDAESSSLRPPPYTDGTPNESVADVFVRVTQLMSILETQYFGESIIIVAPDSDNLSILQAALTGLDLRRHSVLAFAPGEVRYMDLDDRSAQRQVRTSGLVKCKTPTLCG